MKILVVDRDDRVVNQIRSRVEPIGHEAHQEIDKNNLPERLKKERFEIIFVDPSPLSSARPVILNIRRNIGYYPYVFLMSENATLSEAIKAGTNDALAKPFDLKLFDQKIENAQRLTHMIKRIADNSEDFPSAGGVIAKSAFNQLFLSGIDRSDRYGERSFLIFITLSNYNDIKFNDGQYAADYAAAKLSQHLVQMRRQSDIIGQTEKFEFALLLQRPVYETEPVEAANRFAETLAKLENMNKDGKIPADIKLSLIDIPVGSVIVEHNFTPGNTV